MIRKAGQNDFHRIMQIWLETNLTVHDFIRPEYWKNHFDEVEAAIRQADIYVYEQEQTIYGFIGLSDSYIAGVFVDKLCQSQGIGRLLLNHVKQIKYADLTLHVYAKNKRAINFYLRNGFIITSESIDADTGEKEFEMRF